MHISVCHKIMPVKDCFILQRQECHSRQILYIYKCNTLGNESYRKVKSRLYAFDLHKIILFTRAIHTRRPQDHIREMRLVAHIVLRFQLTFSIGRSIVSRPQLLILDEPNSYVDKRFESRFYQLLEDINKESAIILVSHDIGTVLAMVKNIACVNETLHYHPGVDVSEEWLGEKYACPIELIGHGNLPHRVLKTHEH